MWREQHLLTYGATRRNKFSMYLFSSMVKVGRTQRTLPSKFSQFVTNQVKVNLSLCLIKHHANVLQ